MKLSFFQVAVMGAFVFFILLGVGVFALFTTGNSGGIGRVTIWGTEDQNVIDQVLHSINLTDKSFSEVTYVQKKSETYEADLINAMASGVAPDLFLTSQEDVYAFADKVSVIPYQSVPQATYLNSYIDEARLFLTLNGPIAMPFIIDPLVMYYNRDLLTSAGVAQPPKYWSDFISFAPKITSLDNSNNITKSAVALGQWGNVLHAKEILSTLLMQAGDPITTRDSSTGASVPVLGKNPQGAAQNPASSALQFYTEFANPSKTTYSWNRSLPNSQDMFTAGDLAVYFGFASEYNSLVARNPNLHFGVALLPQIQGNSIQLTYGKLIGLAIPRSAGNPQGAFAVAIAMTGQAPIVSLAQATGLPTVRTDVAQDTSADAVGGVFRQSALIARGWIDPNASASSALFKGMIDSVISGGLSPEQAVRDAGESFGALFPSSQ